MALRGFMPTLFLSWWSTPPAAPPVYAILIRRPPRTKAIGGKFTLCLLFTSVIVVVLAAVILASLWFGKDGNIWHAIVSHNFTLRTITITCLGMRLAGAYQVGLCTAMIAALAIEKAGVKQHNAAGVSLHRFQNDGPMYLLPHILPGWNVGRISLFLLALTLTATSLLLQPASTALLWDTEVGIVVGNEQPTKWYPIGFHNFTPEASYGSNYWTTKPILYIPFAEHTEPVAPGDDQFDTGTSLRAFLPGVSGTQAYHMISGDLPVLDTRVVCTRPTAISATLSVDRSMANSVDEIATFFLHGTTTLPSSTTSVSFNCSVPTQNPSSQDPLDVPSAFCVLNDGRTYIFLQQTGTTDDWNTFLNLGSPTNFVPQGRWMELSFPTSANVTLRATLCSAPLAFQTLSVNATAASPPSYAMLHWNTTSMRYNTSAVQSLLQTVHQSGPAALVMKKPTSHKEGAVPFDWMGDNLSIVGKGAAIFCLGCRYSFLAGFKVNVAQVTVFQDILRETENPALAMQAHFTALYQMAYYDRMLEYDAITYIQLTPFVQAIFPHRHAGFTFVAVLVLLHNLLVLVTVILFLSLSESSSLGNAWQAAAQLFANDRVQPSPLARLDDSEVKRHMGKPGASQPFTVSGMQGAIRLSHRANASQA